MSSECVSGLIDSQTLFQFSYLLLLWSLLSLSNSIALCLLKYIFAPGRRERGIWKSVHHVLPFIPSVEVG